MTKPLLLDLFCGGGGASVGYFEAGFDVIGVDKANMPYYPFTFYRGDALELLPQLLSRYDVSVIHASPPCQRYVGLTPDPEMYPDMVNEVRDVVDQTGKLWIMENVMRAPLIDPVMLCGSTFGLGVDAFGEWHQLQRHRYFEANTPLHGHGPCQHSYPTVGVYGRPGGTNRARNKPLCKTGEWKTAMGISWLGQKELAQAIPPAYTEFLGAQLLAGL